MLATNEWFQNIISNIIRAVAGIFVVVILFKVINIICKKIEMRLNENSKVDATISSFVTPLISKIFKLFVLIGYIGYIGIETSSIVAAITSAGLAIGLALQGSLSNFAGGFIILLMRPFKVGDYIETCGESGTVESIQVFYTTLVTIDNKVIKIPNGQVANSSITDASTKSIRRVDLIFSIAHKNDFLKAKKIIKECIDNTGLSLDVPSKPFISIGTYNNTSTDIISRVWVKNDDYWTMYFKLLEDIKTAFDNNNIEPPRSNAEINITDK